MAAGNAVYRTDRLTIAAAPATWLRVGYRPHNGQQELGELTGPDGALALVPGAWAASTGTTFSYVSGGQTPGMAHSYAHDVYGKIDGRLLDAHGGIDAHGARGSGWGQTLSVLESGETHWARGNSAYNGAVVAVQCWARFVRDGAVDTGTSYVDTGRYWRSGVGLLSDGRVCLVACKGLAPVDMARASIAWRGPAGERIKDLWYLDGGGSTHLLTSDGVDEGNPERRRLASWLVLCDPASPGAVAGSVAAGVLGPVAGTVATGVLVAGLALLGVLGAVAYALTR